MILQIKTGLSATAPSLKRSENIRVAAAVQEKAFALAQFHQIHPGAKRLAAPGMRKITLHAEGEARSRSIGEWRIRIGGRNHTIGGRSFVNRSLQQCFR